MLYSEKTADLLKKAPNKIFSKTVPWAEKGWEALVWSIVLTIWCSSRSMFL